MRRSADPNTPSTAVRRLVRSFFLLGLLASSTQIVALREVFCESGGLEAGLAVALSVWLLLAALGNVLGEGLLRTAGRGRTGGLYGGLWIALGVGLGAELLLLRGARHVLFTHPGDALSVLDLAWLSLVALAPCALAVGALFPVGVARFRQVVGPVRTDPQAAVRKLYLLEGVGAACGGALVTLFFWVCARLPSHLKAPGSAFVLWLGALAALGVAAGLMGVFRRRALGWALFVGLVVLAVFGAEWIETATLSLRYPGLPADADPLDRAETPTGQYVVINKGLLQGPRRAYLSGDILYDEDDRPIFEERAALAALSAATDGRRPRVVAVVDNPALALRLGPRGGLLPRRPVLVCTNDATLDLAGRLHGLAKIKWILIDGRGRRLRDALREGLRLDHAAAYGLIVLGGGPPTTVGANRLYTREAFGTARRFLGKRGVLAFFLPSSRNRTGDALAAYLAVVLRTARTVFPHVRVYPGERGGNTVCASRAPLPTGRELAEIRRKLDGSAQAPPPEFFASLDTSLHADQLNRALRRAPPTPLNTALVPAAPLYAYFARETRIGGAETFSAALLRLRAGHVVAGLGVVGAALAVGQLLSRRGRGGAARRIALLGAAIAAGFVNLIFTSILVLVTQAATGNVYLLSGLLVAGFMLGMALGAAASPPRSGGSWRRVAALLLVIGALCLAMAPLAALMLRAAGIVWVLGPALNAVLGFLSAVVFMGLCRLRGRLGVGPLFGADLLGSALGGLAGAALWLPLFGAQVTAALAALVAVSGAALLALGGPAKRLEVGG